MCERNGNAVKFATQTVLGLDLYVKVANLFGNVYCENGFVTPGARASGGPRVRY